MAGWLRNNTLLFLVLNELDAAGLDAVDTGCFFEADGPLLTGLRAGTEDGLNSYEDEEEEGADGEEEEGGGGSLFTRGEEFIPCAGTPLPFASAAAVIDPPLEDLFLSLTAAEAGGELPPPGAAGGAAEAGAVCVLVVS